MVPTDLPGLIWWYRPDSITLNGLNVAGLLDKSGTGDPNKNAIQVNPALRPTFSSVDPLYNNQPTIQFTSSQLLQTQTFSSPVTQPVTRFLVAHTFDASSNRYAADSANAGAQFAFVGQTQLSIFDGASLANPFGNFTAPSISAAVDNGASSAIYTNSTTPGIIGNAGTNGVSNLTLGNYAGGGSFGLDGTFVEYFAYNRILSSTEIAQVMGYLQQRYGIPVLGSLQTAALQGPTLADLTLAAQQRCDRVNASTITSAEWTAMVNASAQELYGVLTSTYEDYNIKSYTFSLVGGSQAGNSLVIGPNSAVPDFFQPRALWLQIGGSPQPYVTIPRLESLNERNRFTFPAIIPVYGAIPSRWNILGSTIEILPPAVAGNTYLLWYVPTLPTLVAATDTIAQYWLTVNGWNEYIVVDVAAKALIKEESLDTAQLLLQQKAQLRDRILREAAPRDISQPRAIVDMSAVRNPWGGWGAGGMSGGWGGDGTGTGCW